MVAPALLVAGGAAILGGVMGAFGAKSANKQARKAARLQSDLTFDQRMEELRRLSFEQDYTEGLATARVAASGVENQGSPTAYLDYIRGEHGKRFQYARRQAYAEKKAIREGAPSGSAGNLQAASSLLSGITAGFGMMG